jgi:hypothetical protein
MSLMPVGISGEGRNAVRVTQRFKQLKQLKKLTDRLALWVIQCRFMRRNSERMRGDNLEVVWCPTNPIRLLSTDWRFRDACFLPHRAFLVSVMVVKNTREEGCAWGAGALDGRLPVLKTLSALVEVRPACRRLAASSLSRMPGKRTHM